MDEVQLMDEVRLIDGNALEQEMREFAAQIFVGCHRTTTDSEEAVHACADMVSEAQTIDPESLPPYWRTCTNTSNTTIVPARKEKVYPSTGSDLKRTFTSISMKQARMRAIFFFGIIAAITQTFPTKSAWLPSAPFLTGNP